MAGMNEAYDLELFQPREGHLRPMQNTAKVTRDRKRRDSRHRLATIAVFLVVAAVVIGVVGYFIYCNVRLTEMNKALADGRSQLGVLQSEEVRLKSELAGLTSAEKINQYALEHGLQPVDSNQIYYITANEEDVVILPDKEESWLSRAWSAVVDFLS